VLLGAGAVVEAGARVGPNVVVGAGSRVRAGAVLRDAVVWEGTEISPGERVERAIAAGAVRLSA
jgi:mannose-1-phosphate guanylyltransferase